MSEMHVARARGRRRWGRRIVFFLVLATLVALALVWWQGPGVPSTAVLVLDLRSPVPERAEEGLAGFFGQRRLDLLGLRSALLAAERDYRVRGVLLRASSGLDLAQAEEVKGIVDGFRRAGKFVVSFAEGVDGPGLVALSGGDEVILDPAEDVQLLGLSLRALFLGDALRRLGLEMDLVRAGEYKGTFEQLTSHEPSPEFRKALEETADSLYGALVEEIAASRKLSPAQVQSAVDEGPLTPARAIELKLADRSAYADELPGILAGRCGGVKPEPIDGVDYLQAVGERGRGTRVAVVHVRGIITDAAAPSLPLIGEITGAEEVAAALREVRADETLKAVVIRIDSSGGTISGSERIWREIDVTRKTKPVVVTMGSAAASGGYYIACAAEHVIAHPSTITGSIGVFGGKLVAAKFLAEHGVQVEFASRGRRAGMFDITRPFTDEQKAALERMVQDSYRQFVDRVATGRKKPFEEAERLGRGRVWTGRQALEHGLVDELGGFEEALAAARRLARLPAGGPLSLVPVPARWSLLDVLGRRRRPSPLAAEFPDPRALEGFLISSGLLDGSHALALSPARLFIR